MISILSFASYLIGSVPFGLIIGRAQGVDVRKTGSGNIGATNVYRSLGIKWGMLVGICDFLKGFICAYLALIIFPISWQALLVSSFSIIGHVFPLWLQGKGGKGVSTTMGVLCVFLGWKIALFAFILWVLFLRVVKIMSLVNCVMAVSFPFLLWFTFKSVPITAIGLSMTFLIWWTHRTNIVRLYAGKEKKLKF